ncbi:golgin-45-like [Urocitellus parryii]
MTILKSLETKVTFTSTPIRGAGDGMETEEPPTSIETTSGVQSIKHHILQSPRKKAAPSENPGVLQLGKILSEKAVEVEAIRIRVPKTAITHDIPNKNGKVKSLGYHRGQPEGVIEPRKELSEVKTVLEKLKNSERRLLQDKEGLSNQLRVQTEVNREFKKLLVASVGDDLQYHFERLAREKNQLILENEALGQNTAQSPLERMSLQCDVWRSKFLSSRYFLF